MQHRQLKREHGKIWLILLVLIALVIGAWQYNENKAEKKRLAIATEQQRAKEAAAKEEQAQRDLERKQLEERLAKEKQQKDALQESNNAIDDVFARWTDAVNVADSTSRISLSGPVSTLQTIRRDAQAITVAPCMDAAKASLISSMDNTIRGFLEFMTNQHNIGKEVARIWLDAGSKDLTKYRDERKLCSL